MQFYLFDLMDCISDTSVRAAENNNGILKRQRC